MQQSSAVSKREPKIVRLPISEIKISFFVRVGTDDDRTQFFMDLYGNGVDVPPIQISSETSELLDGRHRLEALKMLDRTEAECEFVNINTPADQIYFALDQNADGPLPLAHADTIHTLVMLLQQGESRKRIVERLAPHYKVALVRKWLDEAQSAIAKRKLRAAISAVTDGGLNVPDAAEKFGLLPEAIRAELRGKRREKGKSGLRDIKMMLTSRFKSLSLKNAAIMKSLIKDFGDGQATDRQVRAVLDLVAHHIKQAEKSHAGWVRRFEVLVEGDQKSAN